MKLFRIILFVLATWGLILGLPIISVAIIRTIRPDQSWVVALATGGIILVLGIIFGEWWSRIIGAVIFKTPKQETK